MPLSATFAVHSGLDLRHDRLCPVPGLAQADPVHAIDLDPDGADVTAVSANVALDGVSLGGGVADDHQALDLFVLPDDEPGSRSRMRASVRLMTAMFVFSEALCGAPYGDHQGSAYVDDHVAQGLVREPLIHNNSF
jgi:hypothetical protein